MQTYTFYSTLSQYMAMLLAGDITEQLVTGNTRRVRIGVNYLALKIVGDDVYQLDTSINEEVSKALNTFSVYKNL